MSIGFDSRRPSRTSQRQNCFQVDITRLVELAACVDAYPANAVSKLARATSCNDKSSREPAGRSLAIAFRSYDRAETVFGDGRAVFLVAIHRSERG
jgi:hypothetical protein